MRITLYGITIEGNSLDEIKKLIANLPEIAEALKPYAVNVAPVREQRPRVAKAVVLKEGESYIAKYLAEHPEQKNFRMTEDEIELYMTVGLMPKAEAREKAARERLEREGGMVASEGEAMEDPTEQDESDPLG